MTSQARSLLARMRPRCVRSSPSVEPRGQRSRLRDLYLEGKKGEAAAVVPLTLSKHQPIGRCGIRPRIETFKAADVTQLTLLGVGDDPLQPTEEVRSSAAWRPPRAVARAQQAGGSGPDPTTCGSVEAARMVPTTIASPRLAGPNERTRASSRSSGRQRPRAGLSRRSTRYAGG